jgi:hypothetical protein
MFPKFLVILLNSDGSHTSIENAFPAPPVPAPAPPPQTELFASDSEDGDLFGSPPPIIRGLSQTVFSMYSLENVLRLLAPTYSLQTAFDELKGLKLLSQ